MFNRRPATIACKSPSPPTGSGKSFGSSRTAHVTAAHWSLLALVLCAGFATSADAATLNFSGRLDDPTNKALLSSDLSAAVFSGSQAVANNVAIYEFDLTQAGRVQFDSQGYALGGLTPYFSLFNGKGLSGSFVDSNYFTTGADFHLSENLAAGHYTVALGSNQNLSFAENYGSGTLADGFTALGDPSQLGNSSYRFTVSTPVPEPTTLTLAVLGLAFLGLRHKAKPSSLQISLPA